MQPGHRKPDVLFTEARTYEAAGDNYLAIKLYKKIIRQYPDWPAPYERLSNIYKLRAEWKPTLHFSKKALALDSGLADTWWNLGIAATALRKKGIAKSVWSKFGIEQISPHPICIQLRYGRQYEILWIRPIDPARGTIISVPQPIADRRFGDIVLHDREVAGYNIIRQRRIPVYDELDIYKRSAFRTFSCVLHCWEEEYIQSLEKLCADAGLGFEVWSNSVQQLVPSSPTGAAEYFGRDLFPQSPAKGCVVALAAQEEAEVRTVLQQWSVISLQQYSDLRSH